MTPVQSKYLSFIQAYTDGFGQPPSMSEIAEALKVSVPSVNGMLKSLEKKALIRREPKTARSIEILVDRSLIPPWKKKIKANFQFWAMHDANKEDLDEIMEQIIAQRRIARDNKGER